MALVVGAKVRDRKTGDEYNITDVGRTWISYSGPSGEGSVRTEILSEELEVLSDQKLAKQIRPH